MIWKTFEYDEPTVEPVVFGVESLNANNQTVLTSTWKLYINGTLSGTLSRSTLGADISWGTEMES